MSAQQSGEKDSTLTEDEHRSWMELAEHDGWDLVGADSLYARAVEAVAWDLIEQTSDTADLEPSAETYREAMFTAHRLLGALRGNAPAAGEQS